ncbi:peptidoglycan recognition family protein [Azovibrio restrictus]|uniref:peptidoglycan recognition protein family protein n=1 Tax=Azovibrio restrictus TaxID=146938 RepID=UPI0026ED0AD4|nr:peptidoglycan recognition family protein [Azovibrio restrictus]MDD3482819.1 peptidoglycan recognition family protein [Azovibrio restrictus]
MLEIDKMGKVLHPMVKDSISSHIEQGAMPVVKGIIVHQTDSSTASGTLSSYANPNANGAHFLIDKDGTIYQTASVFKKTYHVGRLRSRCLAEMTCEPAELKIAQKWDVAGTHKREMKKAVPERYPSNSDSIGIELVGKAYPVADKKAPPVFEAATPEQNSALKWLVRELRETLSVPLTEVYRHPVVSYKTPSEAESASW